MPSDVFYGADCVARIGIMADQNTDPTNWYPLEFKEMTFSPDRGRSKRPLVGRALNNKLDPVQQRDGLFRVKGEIIQDVDSRGLAQTLACILGQPATTGPTGGIYSHVWASGSETPAYAAIQIQRGSGSGSIRVYRGIALSALSLDGKGDQANNYDASMSVQGISRQDIDTWLTGTIASIFNPAPAARVIMKVGGAAASNVLSASLSWTRKLAEGAFLSQTAQVSELRPDADPEHSGQCTLRAMGLAFDALEAGDTLNDIIMQYTGLPSGHDMQFEHALALLEAAPDPIKGPGLVERDFSWTASQDGSHDALKITIKNDVAAYS